MRLYCIVSGIFLILPIVDFAVAAPILVREKPQAGVDVVHISAITMLAKRVDELDELFLQLFGFLPRPEELSSSRLSEPADGWTDVKKPLSPIPEEPSPEPSPSTTSSFEMFSDDGWWDEDESDHSLAGAEPPQPNTNTRPSNDPDFYQNYGMNLEDLPPRKRPKPASSNEFGQAQEYQAVNVQQPNPGPSNPRLPTEPGYEVATLPASNLGSPKELDDEAAQGSPPNAELTDPELQSDQQSLSTDSQPVDPQDALYAAKGKAKELRRVSGTARDVGDAVKRELQPAEMSLDLGE